MVTRQSSAFGTARGLRLGEHAAESRSMRRWVRAAHAPRRAHSGAIDAPLRYGPRRLERSGAADPPPRMRAERGRGHEKVRREHGDVPNRPLAVARGARPRRARAPSGSMQRGQLERGLGAWSNGEQMIVMDAEINSCCNRRMACPDLRPASGDATRLDRKRPAPSPRLPVLCMSLPSLRAPLGCRSRVPPARTQINPAFSK